jgi:hypothetical protein
VIFTVAIGGVTYEVYGGPAAALQYVAAMMTDGALTFQGWTTAQQAQSLVMASRYIDRQGWQGTATAITGGSTIPPGVATALQWPRSNVVNADGSALDPTTVPPLVVTAAFELCALIANDPNLVTYLDQSANIKGVGAGSARVDYFNPTSRMTGTATLMPPVVQALTGQWLAVAVGDTSWQSRGGECETIVTHCEDESKVRWPW